jgi:hypothetical protein
MLVFVIAVELFLDELAHIHVSHLQRFTISAAIIAGTFAYRHVPLLRAMQPLFHALGVTAHYIDSAFGRLLWPLHLLMGMLSRLTLAYALPLTRRVLQGVLSLRTAWRMAADAIQNRLGMNTARATDGPAAAASQRLADVRAADAERERVA